MEKNIEDKHFRIQLFLLDTTSKGNTLPQVIQSQCIGRDMARRKKVEEGPPQSSLDAFANLVREHSGVNQIASQVPEMPNLPNDASQSNPSPADQIKDDTPAKKQITNTHTENNSSGTETTPRT